MPAALASRSAAAAPAGGPSGDPRLDALRARIAKIVPAPSLAPSVLPTGVPGLDRVLAAGGLPRGAITTLVGPAGAGVTTIWRAMVRAALDADIRVAIVDASRTLYARDFAPLAGPPAQARRDGRLVFIRPPDPTTAAWCADLLLRSGAFPLVVLDHAPPLARTVAGRLSQLAREADAALLVAGDDDTATRVGGLVRLRVRSGRSAAVLLHVEKGASSPRPVEFRCVIPDPHRLCAHPEVPDRRGVARGAVVAGPGADTDANAPRQPASADTTRSGHSPPIRRGRRAAEPRLARRGA